MSAHYVMRKIAAQKVSNASGAYLTEVLCWYSQFRPLEVELSISAIGETWVLERRTLHNGMGHAINQEHGTGCQIKIAPVLGDRSKVSITHWGSSSDPNRYARLEMDCTQVDLFIHETCHCVPFEDESRYAFEEIDRGLKELLP